MIRSNIQSPLRQFGLFKRTYVSKMIKSKLHSKESTTKEVPLDESINVGFFVRTIGSTYSKWNSILEKHPELKSLKRKDLANSAKCLKSLNYGTDEIIAKPMILYSNTLTLENRNSVLQECGFQPITITLLAKYVAVMNKTASYHKIHHHVPYDIDVLERLRTRFTDVDVDLSKQPKCSEDMELKLIRQIILNGYLQQRLDMSEGDIEKLWKLYARVRHRNFKSVQTMIHVLLNDLQFPKERIIKHGYLLHGDADNVSRIITEIPTIDGIDMREIVYRRPKILMSSCDSLLRTLEHVKAFGIGESSVIRCLEILTLGSDTVLERLRDLNEIEEFQVLVTNPRVLRLVHYQNKARLRLEYLNQLKVRCASLHILSCGSVAFAKFARDGSDRTKGRDIVVFLANVLHKDEVLVRSTLSRHSNWCQIPIIHIKQCYEFFLSKQFQPDVIFRNIHLLLYPIKRIEEKLQQIYTPTFIDELNLNITVDDLSSNEILTLILYLIESEFHFTGDGIWTDQHTQQVENFNNLLPDFPESLNKVYKYGVRHNTSKADVLQTAM